MAFEGRDPLGIGSWREVGGFGEHERHGAALVSRRREEQATSLSPSSSRMAEAYPHEGAFRGFGGLSDRTQQEIDVVGVDQGRQLNTRKLALVMPEHHAAVGGDAVDPPIAA